MRPSELEQPFICTSIVDEDVKSAISTIKAAEYQGARAFEIHLPLLGFPGETELERLANATTWPVYATCRRGTFYELLGSDEGVDIDDEERIERLITAVKAGLDGIDFELDTFDRQTGPDSFSEEAIATYATDDRTDPAEVTDDSDAIANQRAVVKDVHEAGGDVIMSAHTYKHLAPADAVAIAERMTERGADFCKIVGVDGTMDDALDTLTAHLELNESGCAPYALMAIGEPSRIVRPISPMFGSAWIFAQPELIPGGFHSWPLVDNAHEVLRRIDWRTVHMPHE